MVRARSSYSDAVNATGAARLAQGGSMSLLSFIDEELALLTALASALPPG